MVEIFKAKVRNVGTSLGILLPGKIVREEKIREGEKIEVSILKKNLKLIEESFGIARGASKFKREHIEREF